MITEAIICPLNLGMHTGTQRQINTEPGNERIQNKASILKFRHQHPIAQPSKKNPDVQWLTHD